MYIWRRYNVGVYDSATIETHSPMNVFRFSGQGNRNNNANSNKNRPMHKAKEGARKCERKRASSPESSELKKKEEAKLPKNKGCAYGIIYRIRTGYLILYKYIVCLIQSHSQQFWCTIYEKKNTKRIRVAIFTPYAHALWPIALIP